MSQSSWDFRINPGMSDAIATFHRNSHPWFAPDAGSLEISNLWQPLGGDVNPSADGIVEPENLWGSYVGDFLLPSESLRLSSDSLGDVTERSATQRRDIITGGLAGDSGDKAMFADVVRQEFGLDGTGVTIGVISDSFDVDERARTRAFNDFATRDLPLNLSVIAEANSKVFPNTGDEGRAMMQLIHRVAPGAKLLFHTVADASDRELATAILNLADAGANAIVDDVRAIEPFFQEGLTARAVKEVVARGVTYLTAAGNQGQGAYQSAFRNSGLVLAPNAYLYKNAGQVFFGGVAHDFDPGPNQDLVQGFTLLPGERLTFHLQWDSPFASSSGGEGSPNDLDIYVLDETAQRIVASSATKNIGFDPVETVSLFNSEFVPVRYNLAVFWNQGPQPALLRYHALDTSTLLPKDLEFKTNSPTLYGHANVEEAITVGASNYRFTPRFGTNPPKLDDFGDDRVESGSALGGVPILFDVTGARLPTPEFYRKPNIVAPNGVNTTFFGLEDPLSVGRYEADGLPNFFGTSAAAPYAAGVVALMLQAVPDATPAEIKTALESTALDMDLPGFDPGSGYGFIQAPQAVRALVAIAQNRVQLS